MDIHLTKQQVYDAYKWGLGRTVEMTDVHKTGRAQDVKTNVQNDILGVVNEYAHLLHALSKAPHLSFDPNNIEATFALWCPLGDKIKDRHYWKGPDIAGFIECKRLTKPSYNIQLNQREVDRKTVVMAGYVHYEWSTDKPNMIDY